MHSQSLKPPNFFKKNKDHKYVRMQSMKPVDGLQFTIPLSGHLIERVTSSPTPFTYLAFQLPARVSVSLP